jgi:hypothetical protein
MPRSSPPVPMPCSSRRSQDLWHQHLWRWLDADAKATLRVVSKGMRSQVDAAVQVVASPSSGASANELASALLRWPAVRELTVCQRFE